jgi:hypothetical protein
MGPTTNIVLGEEVAVSCLTMNLIVLVFPLPGEPVIKSFAM